MIVANKFTKVRACWVPREEDALSAAAEDAGNVICLPARSLTLDQAQR